MQRDSRWVSDPEVVMRPMYPGASDSGRVSAVNHSSPSGPAAIAPSRAASWVGNSVMTPSGVILPTLRPVSSVNHRFPSGPTAIPNGPLPLVGIAYEVTRPVDVIRPISLALSSVNH